MKKYNVKLWMSLEENEIVQTFLKNSGEKPQDFFTLVAIKALTLEVNPPEKPIKILDQFYLDSTIHKKLKEKSEVLGMDLKDLILEAIKKTSF